jgi:hypothetical protein
MKRIVTFTVCAALIAVCFSGCVAVNFSDLNTVAGKGELERYELRVEEFNSIKTTGTFDIRYRAAFSNTLVLEIQPNLREYFSAEVINGELVVSTTKRISSNKIPVLTVSTPVLNSLNIAGACNFTAYDPIKTDSFTLKVSGAGSGNAELDVNSLYFDLSGAGDYDFSGRAGNVDINMSGAGNVKALSLRTQTARISLSGTGSVAINCAENLTIDASGMGSVEYKGSPSININRSGMVSIKKLD